MEEFSEELLARAVRTLSRRDPILRALANQHGLPTFRPHSDYFVTLVGAIISQQISTEAARSINARLLASFGSRFDPAEMAAASDLAFRTSGISPQKLAYLRSLCEHVNDGRLDLDRLPMLSSDEVIAELVAVRGMGIWTAQMFLIFSLGRLDILPTGDLGVRKGTQIAYDLSELPTPRQIEGISEQRAWAPYRSVASWYMWRALKS